MSETAGLTITNSTAMIDPIEVVEWQRSPIARPPEPSSTASISSWCDGTTQHSVMSGRCRHRGALLADGRVDGANLICGVHGWDYRMDTGVSSYDTSDRLRRFRSIVADGSVFIDRAELADYRRVEGLSLDGPVDEYEHHYRNAHGNTAEEPFVADIHELALHGLERIGHHGPVAAMGVERTSLPSWDASAVRHRPTGPLPAARRRGGRHRRRDRRQRRPGRCTSTSRSSSAT